MQTTIETERLILRKPVVEDTPDIQHLVNHPTISRNTSGIPYPYPDGAAIEFIEEVVNPGWQRGADFAFAVTLKADSTFIGMMGIHLHKHNRAEIGYWLGEPYWGKGYATEAAQRVVQCGFEELKLNRIQAEYFTFNPASRRVMEKIGMTFEGVLRNYICKNGEYIDVGMCAILREDWQT